MNGWKFKISTIVCAWLLLASVPIGSARPIDEAAVDGLARSALTLWEVPGAAVVVVTRDRVLVTKGYGVRELGKPEVIDADTVFPIASCSKAFTSLLISQLADDGKITWDDPVRKYVPDLHLSDPVADAGISVRDLLCHRTGLPNHDYLWYHSPLSQDEVIRRCVHLPLTKPFRTTFQYQNLMAMVAGHAITKAGGRPWDEIARQRIFEPLKMRHTTCTTPARGCATPHRPNAAGILEPIAPYELRTPNAALSIHTTARDFANWLVFQLGDGSFEGKRIVSTTGLAETHAPQIPQRIEGLNRLMSPDTLMMSYGLGWVIHDYRGHLLWSHTGYIDGFRAQVALAPRDGIGVAVFSNRFETRMNLALVNELLDRQLNLPSRDWHTYLNDVLTEENRFKKQEQESRDSLRHPAGRPVQPLSEFVGQYSNPAYGDTEMRFENNQLQFVWNQFRVPMKYYRDLEFDLPDRNLREQTLRFHINDGKIAGFHLFGVEFKRK